MPRWDAAIDLIGPPTAKVRVLLDVDSHCLLVHSLVGYTGTNPTTAANTIPDTGSH